MKGDFEPVADDSVERFMGVVWAIADAFGVENVPEVKAALCGLSDAVAEYSYTKHVGKKRDHSLEANRKRYIGLFKARYYQHTGLEYQAKVTPADGKMVGQGVKLLAEKGFDVDDYLDWLFGVFIPENDKFKTMMIKQSASQFVMHTFLADRRDVSAEREKVVELTDIVEGMIERAKTLAGGKYATAEHKERLRSALRDFGQRCIVLKDLKRIVDEVERETEG